MIWLQPSHLSHKPSVRMRFSPSFDPSAPDFSLENHAMENLSQRSRRLSGITNVSCELAPFRESHLMVEADGARVRRRYGETDALASVRRQSEQRPPHERISGSGAP